MIFGGVETGGTWCVCAVGAGPDDIHAFDRFRTGAPEETIERIAAFFEPFAEELAALGVGAFGPVDLDEESPTWGNVTTTPKPGWQHTPLARALGDRLKVPLTFETDVNAAAVGEQRWGAGGDVRSLCYLTVGTGIGGGLVLEGRPVHGLVHPEVGHLRIPHDRAGDPFDGVCPMHGDCWEGLASGPAIAKRWDCEPASLSDEHPAWDLEAEYLALGIVSIVLVASPERVVVGGGVLARGGLLARVREKVPELIAGYLETPALGERIDEYIVAPALGDRAGVLGALALAENRVRNR